MLTSRQFTNPERDDTKAKNIQEGAKLLLFAIRKRLGFLPSFHVPFSEDQKLAVDELIVASQQSAITTDHIHRAFYSLVNSEIIDSPDGRYSHVIEGFLTIFARSDDAKGWKPLPEVSSMLARVEWCIRTSVVFDTHLCANDYPNGRNG